MSEDFDNYRRIFDRGDDLQGAAAIRALLHVDVEDPVGEQKRGRESFIDSQEGHLIKAMSCRVARVFPPVDWPTIF